MTPPKSVISLFIMVILMGCTTTPTAETGTLLIDVRTPLHEISPLVYGTNYGPWNVVPFDLQDEAADAGFTWLRFPGGNWGDENDLRTYHIDQLMLLADSLNAEPSITVRLRDGSAEKAAELVRYTNIEEGHGVRYWAIGNEPNLYDGRDYTVAEFNKDWRTIADAMLEVDPDIQFIGPDVTNYDPGNPPTDKNGEPWVAGFLEANGDLVSVVAVHRYPFPLSLTAPTATKDQLRADAAVWDEVVLTLKEEVRTATGRDIPVAFTEVNSHWTSATGGEGTPDSLYSALWWADVMATFIQEDVEMVAQFAIQSPASFGGWGLFSRLEPRPAYYVYLLYRDFGSQMVRADVAVEGVTAIAALTDSGDLTIMLINLTDDDIDVPLDVRGFRTASIAATRLDAEHNAEAVDAQSLDLLTVPAESVTLYTLSP